MSENQEIKFIKPCRMPHEGHRMLTPELAVLAFRQKRIVQINLDNCVIQRMERLPPDPSLDDVEEVGLLPLVNILQAAPVALSAIGINEMPDKWVAGARAAYEQFCARFWPDHMDDIEATERDYDADSDAKTVEFRELGEGQRSSYGSAYVALLQMQNVRRAYSSQSPEQQFEIYLHSMIGMLDLVNAFELELAKHAFWDLSVNEINQLPENIQSRLRDIKENFTKLHSSLQKCKKSAFNGAMDIHWLSGANLSQDLNLTLKVNKAELLVDNWVGTTDHKLYRISKDMHSVYAEGSRMKRFACTREVALEGYPYWKHVDRLANDILGYRAREGYTPLKGLLQRIDRSVTQLEGDLAKFF